MKLENTFTVPVPRAQAWKVLLDVERIAPCMPGATLTSREGDAFTGTVKVKVGPINLTYGGQAQFVSLDEDAGVAVIEGSGKETRGTGTAKATITCRLTEQDGTTRVDVDTDLNVTGKPAQFGRGVLADVSAKLVDRFAACLSQEIAQGDAKPEPAVAAPEPAGAEPVAEPVAAPAGAGPAVSVGEGGAAVAAGTVNGAPAAPAAAPAALRPVREAEPIDLLDTAGMPVLKRLGPVVLLVGLVVVFLLKRRRH